MESKRLYKLVLTGGPCGGKTIGQSRLSQFFENLGWKVLRVPETASVLLGGGVKFAELTNDETVKFQENLVRTMIQIENTYFELGQSSIENCLIICDRGVMDASAYMSPTNWNRMLAKNNWNHTELCDDRYNHILHLTSAANGAEKFYTIEKHVCRSEGADLARQLDSKAAKAWLGHPNFDIIDNSTDFEMKIERLIQCVCQKLGINVDYCSQSTEMKERKLKRG